jgi:hypothetical protein
VDFDVIDQLLIRYFAFVIYRIKNGSSVGQNVRYFYTSKERMIQLGKYYTTF